MSEHIIFEQPLNERIRTFLRLEFLFKRIARSMMGDSEQHHRDALDALLSMLNVFERGDLKQEIMKEIERLISNLSALEHMPGVDKQVLDGLLAELDESLDALYMQKSSLGQSLKDNDFLYGIRQRSSIPGGTCEFDLPAYHFWLQHTPATTRAEQLDHWLTHCSPVKHAVNISLRLIRNSTGFRDEQATDGFFQSNLDSSHPYQLIRVEVDKSAVLFPEISGGKHRFTVRFMQFDINQRPQQAFTTVPFRLSCCAM